MCRACRLVYPRLICSLCSVTNSPLDRPAAVFGAANEETDACGLVYGQVSPAPLSSNRPRERGMLELPRISESLMCFGYFFSQLLFCLVLHLLVKGERMSGQPCSAIAEHAAISVTTSSDNVTTSCVAQSASSLSSAKEEDEDGMLPIERQLVGAASMA